MKKVGIISQARMASTRLPGKLMLSIKGKPLLQYFVERLEKSGIPLYIATSTESNNDIIAGFCEEHDITCFRGDENNILKRYYDCAVEHKLDVIIRITSDCPLSDGAVVKEALETYLAFNDENVHYSNCVELTCPHGMNFEIFSFKLLEEAYKNATDDFDKEHATPYIIKNKSGNVVLKHYTIDKNAHDYRVTVDTYDDFKLMRKLIEEYGADTKNQDEIISIFEAHSELVEMNRPKKPHVWALDKK
ncbi:MAG: glycosyltransferase family protein [Patescibacteria group bacterium]